jgi:hypothetical protein
MKGFAILSLLSAFVVKAVVVPPKINLTEHRIDWKVEQKRQALGALTWLIGKGGKVADPPGATPRRQLIQSDSKIAGVKRVKMRYGPYQVPNMGRTGLTGEAGSLWKSVSTLLLRDALALIEY